MEPEADLVEAIESAEEPEIEPQPDDLEEEEGQQEYPDYLNIKVDCETRKVEASKVWDAGLRTLQKQEAADVRLEEAANLKRDAEKTLQEAESKAQSIAPTAEKAKVIREVVENFEINYPELAGDENLRNLVIMESNKMMAEGRENSWKVYSEAAEKIQKWHGGITESRSIEQTWQTKRDRKVKAAGTTITGVNAKTTTMKVPEKQESPSDIIKEMREARGQE